MITCFAEEVIREKEWELRGVCVVSGELLLSCLFQIRIRFRMCARSFQKVCRMCDGSTPAREEN